MGILERKEREKGHRKDEIIDAAKKVFFEKGLLVATMDDIATAAELSKGTLYLYYKSKEDLYLAVMMQGLQILSEMFEQAIRSSSTTIEKISELVNVYGNFFDRHRNYFRMMHFFQTPQFHKQVTDEMKQTCTEVNQKLWDLVIGVLKQGMEEGLLRKDLNPIEIAIILWSSSASLMMRIDSEDQHWMDRMQIDLKHTLKISNALFFKSILTEQAQAELSALVQ